MLEFMNNIMPFSWCCIFFFLFGLFAIVMGFLEARVPKEAYNNEEHPLHKQARRIYATTHDLHGLPYEGVNGGCVAIGIGLCLCLFFGALIYMLWNNGTFTTFLYYHMHLK